MNIESTMIELYSAYITGREPKCGMINDEDFYKLKIKTDYQKIFSACMDTVLKYHLISQDSKNIKYIKYRILCDIKYYYSKLDYFKSIYSQLTDNGIVPVLVKGFVCNNNYLLPEYRISADEDIVIVGDDFKKCIDIFTKNGFVAEKGNREHEMDFYNSDMGLKIEVHNKLFADNGTSFEIFNNFIDLKLLKKDNIDGMEIFILDDTEHFIYLVLHAFRHFIKNGIGLRQVSDIILSLQNNDINLIKVFDVCKKVNATVFFNAIIVFGLRYFNLDINKISDIKDSIDLELYINDFIEDITSNGIYGDNSNAAHHSSMQLDILYGDSISRKKSGKSAIIFPDVKKIRHRYTYLKKFPFLLPFAWIQRIFNYLFIDKNTKATDEKLKKRILLLKKYKVIGD